MISYDELSSVISLFKQIMEIINNFIVMAGHIISTLNFLIKIKFHDRKKLTLNSISFLNKLAQTSSRQKSHFRVMVDHIRSPILNFVFFLLLPENQKILV